MNFNAELWCDKEKVVWKVITWMKHMVDYVMTILISYLCSKYFNFLHGTHCCVTKWLSDLNARNPNNQFENELCLEQCLAIKEDRGNNLIVT